MHDMKRAEKEKISARHAEISKALIQNNHKELKRLCGSKDKAEAELQELEHFLNYK